jgi:y4mF family transcriptional regulator
MLLHINNIYLINIYAFAYNSLFLFKINAKAYNMKTLANFVKEKRNEVKLTQEAFSERAGVALTVIRKIEQGKENLNLEKVNQVLKMFGHTLAPVNARELSKNDE